MTYEDNDTEDQVTISTHTLTWSVTYAVTHLLHGSGNFNSHAHVERDKFYK